jgi:hypothetical protein
LVSASWKLLALVQPADSLLAEAVDVDRQDVRLRVLDRDVVAAFGAMDEQRGVSERGGSGILGVGHGRIMDDGFLGARSKYPL